MTEAQLSRFEKHVIPEPNSGCWLWIGHRDRAGYGGVTIDSRTRRAHRVAYEHFNGPIGYGLVIDHLCRNTSCVNPSHLEAVSTKENLNRGVHRNAIKRVCIRGHHFDQLNTYRDGRGGRRCRLCALITQRERRARKAG